MPTSGNRPNDGRSGPKGQPMTPIPSATLVVLCPLSVPKKSPASKPFGVSTLMVQRSSRIGSSFRSAVVFPGGALDIADDLATSCPHDVTDPTDPRYQNALRLSALRETFEETGLLLVPSTESSRTVDIGVPFSRAVGFKQTGLSEEEWQKARNEVHNDASTFVPFLRRVEAHLHTTGPSSSSGLPPLAPLMHHSNWVTPRGVVRPAKRFDAHFFVTMLDAPDALGSITMAEEDQSKAGPPPSDAGAQKLALSADGTETLSLRIDTPAALCEAAVQDKLTLFPPQFYILADLAATLSDGPGATLVPLNFASCPTAPTLIQTHRPLQGDKGTLTPTPVEEEPRGLSPEANFSWDRREPGDPVPASADGPDKSSWVAPPSSTHTHTQPVTPVEPHAYPQYGMQMATPSSVAVAPAGKSNGGVKTGESGEYVRDEEEQNDDSSGPFVFPLVLPGDVQASPAQQVAAGGPASRSASSSHTSPALNRLFISPRPSAEGGGLIVRGAMRTADVGCRSDGRGGLGAFRIGYCLKFEDEEDGGEEERSEGARSKSRL